MSNDEKKIPDVKHSLSDIFTSDVLNKVAEEVDKSLLNQMKIPPFEGHSAFRNEYEWGLKMPYTRSPLLPTVTDEPQAPKASALLSVAGVPDSISEALVGLSEWDWEKAAAMKSDTSPFRRWCTEDVCNVFDPLGLNLFSIIKMDPGSDARFPLDFYRPKGDRTQAVVVPREGGVPVPAVQGDEIYVPTYKTPNAVSWRSDYARDQRFDVLARAIEVFLTGFKDKIRDDQLSLLTHTGAHNTDRPIEPGGVGEFLDLAAQQGARVTDILCEPEMMCLVQAAYAEKHAIPRWDLKGIRIHPEYENMRKHDSLTLDGVAYHLVNDVSESAKRLGMIKSPAEPGLARRLWEMINKKARRERLSREDSRSRVCIGIDRNKNGLVVPVREKMQCFNDPTVSRSDDKQGLYGWVECGIACLDESCVVLSHEFDPSPLAKAALESRIARLKGFCNKIWNWDPIAWLRS